MYVIVFQQNLSFFFYFCWKIFDRSSWNVLRFLVFLFAIAVTSWLKITFFTFFLFCLFHEFHTIVAIMVIFFVLFFAVSANFCWFITVFHIKNTKNCFTDSSLRIVWRYSWKTKNNTKSISACNHLYNEFYWSFGQT